MAIGRINRTYSMFKIDMSLKFGDTKNKSISLINPEKKIMK